MNSSPIVMGYYALFTILFFLVIGFLPAIVASGVAARRVGPSSTGCWE
jgi:hypothetical protein